MTTSISAEFKITYTQFLDSDGQALGELPAFAHDKKIMLELYRWMVVTRTFDAKAINLQRTGKMGTYASSLGQEAISVGFGHAMQANDVLVPAYREYGAQFQRGVEMSEILAFWGGMERGNAYQHCPEDFPIAVPIGTQPLHAAGVAAAFKYRKQKRVAVAVCGDGATSEGDFYEAINVAGAWHLPVVFVVANNQWAISLSRKQQTNSETIAQKAIAAGILGKQVDGNDVIAMREVSLQALERARSGKGPTIIEAITYRLHDHTTADDATRYRGKEEVENAWKNEPVRRLKIYIESQGWWTAQDEEKLQQEAQEKVEKAVKEYFALPAEPVTAMFDYHFAKLPHDLAEQREIAEAFFDSKASHH
ncbi:MAG: odpA [Gammaproteobacteria bacterium]|jgi:pyruvate dehydrogenase E1 component alpha subunit|nr:odpA [Gammaproteobacteria bacterium]